MSTRNGCRILSGMYQRRAAVWEGRGATARTPEAKWSSGDAAVFWGILPLSHKSGELWACNCLRTYTFPIILSLGSLER